MPWRWRLRKGAAGSEKAATSSGDNDEEDDIERSTSFNAPAERHHGPGGRSTPVAAAAAGTSPNATTAPASAFGPPAEARPDLSKSSLSGGSSLKLPGREVEVEPPAVLSPEDGSQPVLERSCYCNIVDRMAGLWVQEGSMKIASESSGAAAGVGFEHVLGEAELRAKAATTVLEESSDSPFADFSYAAEAGAPGSALGPSVAAPWPTPMPSSAPAPRIEPPSPRPPPLPSVPAPPTLPAAQPVASLQFAAASMGSFRAAPSGEHGSFTAPTAVPATAIGGAGGVGRKPSSGGGGWVGESGGSSSSMTPFASSSFPSALPAVGAGPALPGINAVHALPGFGPVHRLDSGGLSSSSGGRAPSGYQAGVDGIGSGGSGTGSGSRRGPAGAQAAIVGDPGLAPGVGPGSGGAWGPETGGVEELSRGGAVPGGSGPTFSRRGTAGTEGAAVAGQAGGRGYGSRGVPNVGAGGLPNVGLTGGSNTVHGGGSAQGSLDPALQLKESLLSIRGMKVQS